MNTAATLDADINDWTVIDLGGTRRKVGGSLANNSAALMGWTQGASSSSSGMSASSGSSGGGSSGLVKQIHVQKAPLCGAFFYVWWPGAESNHRLADFQSIGGVSVVIFLISDRGARCLVCIIVHGDAQ